MKAVLVLLVSTAIASAEITLPSTITVGGETYKEVVYQSKDAATVRFMHADGIAAIPIAKLPEDLQKLLGYDPAKAADQLKKDADQKHLAALQMAAKQDKAREQYAAGGDERKSNEIDLKIKSLKENIVSAKAEINSLQGTIDKKTKINSTTYTFDDGSSTTASTVTEAKSPEQAARHKRVDALNEAISQWEDQIIKLGGRPD